jgi:small-conductance mechanosensitive channel
VSEANVNQGDIEEILIALLVVTVGLLISWLLATQAKRLMHLITKATQTEIDDFLAEAIKGPLILAIAISSIYAGLNILSYMEPYLRTIQKIWFAFILFFAVIALRRVVLGLLDWISQSGDVSGLPGFDPRSMPFLKRIINVVIITVGALLVLDVIGVSISPLLAGLGLGGLAVALALQPLLSNIFASSYVITDSSIAVGDFVEVSGGPLGVVEDIGWRATRIRTFDNNIVMVPNAAVADSVITNFDSADARADARVDCGIAYEEDLDRVESIVVEEMNKLLDYDYVDSARKPFFRYSEFGDSNVNFFVKMRAVTWADSFTLKHEMMKHIHRRLTTEGIVINYPARRLMLAKEDVDGLDRLLSK